MRWRVCRKVDTTKPSLVKMTDEVMLELRTWRKHPSFDECPKSKRPLVKTSPNWSKRPQIGQNVPMVKNVGQNVPKMIFYYIFYEILDIIWDGWMKLFKIKLFLFFIQIPFCYFSKIASRMQFFRQPFYTRSFKYYIILYSLAFDDLLCGNYQTIALLVNLDCSYLISSKHKV